jgi:hypothetical protein
MGVEVGGRNYLLESAAEGSKIQERFFEPGDRFDSLAANLAYG